jgi:hypothetical protein
VLVLEKILPLKQIIHTIFGIRVIVHGCRHKRLNALSDGDVNLA